MIIAGQKEIALYTARQPYPNGEFHNLEAAKVNSAVLAATSGKLPCFAFGRGKKGAMGWVSVNSSAFIPRGTAKEWLARYGVDIDAIESAS